MAPFKEWINVTERFKARCKRMKAAMNEPLPPTCASYTKRLKAPAKSVTERSQNANYTAAQRLQVLILHEADIADKIACAAAGVKDVRCIKRWLKRAEEAEYDKTTQILELKHVQDRCRSDRSIRCGSAQQAAIIETVTKDRNGREMSAAALGYKHDFSQRTVLRVLRKHKFKCVKLTIKSDLTEEMIQKRYDFAMKYKDWIVKDWKRVI